MLSKDEIKELTHLLELTWTKRNGIDQGMVDHCLKNSKYIKIDDMFVSVCDAKPSISKTIWYDDTRKGPDANWQNFKALNERNNMPTPWNLEHHWKELYFVVHYSGDKKGGKLVALGLYEDSEADRAGVIRKVTPEELTQINAAIEEVRQDYAKRLETYWKRYSNQVTSQGYWVDR